jgi:hypothetical protein
MFPVARLLFLLIMMPLSNRCCMFITCFICIVKALVTLIKCDKPEKETKTFWSEVWRFFCDGSYNIVWVLVVLTKVNKEDSYGWSDCCFIRNSRRAWPPQGESSQRLLVVRLTHQTCLVSLTDEARVMDQVRDAQCTGLWQYNFIIIAYFQVGKCIRKLDSCDFIIPKLYHQGAGKLFLLTSKFWMKSLQKIWGIGSYVTLLLICKYTKLNCLRHARINVHIYITLHLRP